MEAAGQVIQGVGDYIAAVPVRARRGWEGGGARGLGQAPRPAREAAQGRGGGAPAGHECPVAEHPGCWASEATRTGRAGGSSDVVRRPERRERPPQRPPRQCGRAQAHSLTAPRRPPVPSYVGPRPPPPG